jgi:peptide/nickel transport system ATP-binding protein/oligopeptide transport system ATP-binding protein
VPALREVVPGHWTACHLHDGGVRFPLAINVIARSAATKQSP